MTAKEYLSKIQADRAILESLEEKIEELRHQATGVKAIVYDKDRVQTTPENRFEEIMARLDAEIEKWTKMKLRYEKEVRKITEQIAGLGRADYVDILRLRYINDMPLSDIADRICLSFGRTAHLHGEALEAFRRKYL